MPEGRFPHRPRSGGRWRALVVAATAAAVSAAVLPGAPFAADTDAPTAKAAATPPAADVNKPISVEGLTGATHTVTLVTGDQVKLSRTPGGAYAVDLLPSQRPDGYQARLFVRTGPTGTYAIPDDAQAAVDSGKLDRELFNISYLAGNGYADADAQQMPVIVQYAGKRTGSAVASAAEALPASRAGLTLESIDAAAVKVAKKDAGDFWVAVRAKPGNAHQTLNAVPGTLRGGVTRVWLDRKVKADLDVSVPMIGAPHAWAAGHDGAGVRVAVLDTGIDADHPDLRGKVVASKSFVGTDDVSDGHGHGTHVASTIAGSGAAAGGAYKGVAPGAGLMIGKVLDDSGSGLLSGAVEGMEWATGNGADVVSMSLGAEPTDGTDPASLAVNDLSASTDTLFVIAAGNSGAPETVSTPGTADAALTVAAVDKSDQLAGFSSQGPRFGDSALKPDIAAPGANIVAARASGTTMGTPLNDDYTSASGTSMATPHVAGAAAIMVQLHPDWTGQQIKSALMSSSRDDGFTAYEQGAGRLDLARAHDQQVFAKSGNVDFGSVPADSEPLQRTLSYTNHSDQPVTLTLKPALRTAAGAAVEGVLSLADTTLTVPAGGTADTTVTLTPAGLDMGNYTGAVTAAADGVQLTTPVGVVREIPQHLLTVHTVGRDGRPQTPHSQSIIDVAGDKGSLTSTPVVTDTGTVVTEVPEGVISLAQITSWVDDDNRSNSAWLFSPELTITGDTEITLDARQATQVAFSAPKPAEPLNNSYTVHFQRTAADGRTWGGTLLNGEPFGAWEKLWALPTKAVTTGTFRFATQWTLGAPQVTMEVVGKRGLTLHPAAPMHEFYDRQSYHPEWKPFTGTRNLPVIDVGEGRPEDLEGLDVRGKLALMAAPHADTVMGPACGAQIERMNDVRDAGAAGIAIAPTKEASCPLPMSIAQQPFTGEPKPVGIPNAFISHKEATQLRQRLAEEPVTMRVVGTPVTPYDYVFKPYAEQRIPRSMHYAYTEKDLARVDLDVHASRPTGYSDYRYLYKQDDVVIGATSVSDWGARAYMGPHRRTEWIGTLAPDVYHEHGMAGLSPDDLTWYGQRFRTEVWDRPVRVRQQWFADPTTPGAATTSDQAYRLADPDAAPYEKRGLDLPCSICVQGDKLWTDFTMVNGAGNRRDLGFGFWQQGKLLTPNYAMRLYRDGTEIPATPHAALPNIPRFTLPDGPGRYRLTAKNDQHDAEWTFTAPPAEGSQQPGMNCTSWVTEGRSEWCRPTPVVFASYDLGDTLALDNTVRAGRSHKFTVQAYHSPSGAKMPAIAGLKLWQSTDDGRTFTPVKVRRTADGTYTAMAHYPKLAATTGAVTLKVMAWDADGNTLRQTTTRAFALR